MPSVASHVLPERIARAERQVLQTLAHGIQSQRRLLHVMHALRSAEVLVDSSSPLAELKPCECAEIIVSKTPRCDHAFGYIAWLP